MRKYVTYSQKPFPNDTHADIQDGTARLDFIGA